MTEEAGKLPEGQTADWKATLPEDMRGNEAIAGFKDVGELAKDYLTVREKAAASVVALPESAEKYTIELPKVGEGDKQVAPVTEAEVKEIRDYAFRLKMTNEQAQEMVNITAKERAEAFELYKAEQEKLLAPLKKEWGGKYDEHLAESNLAVTKLGGKELHDALKKYGAGADPVFIKLFHKLLPLVSEGGVLEGERHSSTANSEADLASRLYPPQ